ncbi:MAG: polyprenyl synthetase family protein [Ignavibacteriaceae bacterium]
MISEKEFNSLIEKERKLINTKLKSVLAKRNPRSLYEPSDYILADQGKRLRPLLVLLTAKAVGGNYAKAYNAALAVEMLHNFTLVHDDIMDNADKRRNKLTVHIKYDVNTAILAGDGLLAVAYEYLLKNLIVPGNEVVKSFTKGLVEVCEGQSLDKEFEVKKDVSIEEYLIMISKKTAAMIEMCCEVGARIGGGSSSEIKALTRFGKNLGIAFQIQDDLLDIAGDEVEFGKKIGGDLIEGKKTFLFLKALEKSKGKDKAAFQKIIVNKGIQPGEVEKYKMLYQKLDVLNDAKKEIVLYTQKALRQLNQIKNVNDRQLLTFLAYSLIKRKY